MDNSNFSAVLGWKLRSLLADRIRMNVSKESWAITMCDPVLHFQSTEDHGRSIHWQLSWSETEDGDDTLQIDAHITIPDIPHYQTVPEFEQPVLASSALFFEEAVVCKVVGYGFQAKESNHLTAVAIHTKAGCVMVETGLGGVMTVTVSDVATMTRGDILIETEG